MSSFNIIHGPQFHTWFFRANPTLRCKCPTAITASLHMSTDSEFLNNKKKEISLQLSSLSPPVSRVDTVRFCDLRFDRLQPSDDELEPHDRFEFGNFVARKALLDVEYWTAAWLRAECHWENQTHGRYTITTDYSDFCKRKFADQEFDKLKKRSRGQEADFLSSTCIITVRKEQKNVKRSVIKSVVGTLDLNIRYLLLGETFPGELVDPPPFCAINRTPSSKYGYIANLCVAKSARRKGVASNMLYFAVESAKSNGVSRLYAHVDRYNEPAQILFHNLGFELVEKANPLLVKHRTYLLCLEM